MTTNSFGGPLPFQVHRPAPVVTTQAKIAKAFPWALVATTGAAALYYMYAPQAAANTLRSFSMGAAPLDQKTSIPSPTQIQDNGQQIHGKLEKGVKS